MSVPRRPGGGEPSANSVESGLRRLVVDTGPSVARLVRDEHDGVRAIMLAANGPPDWTAEETAHAVLLILHELIEGITNPRWKASALAAFRMPASEFEGIDSDSVAGRWRVAARRAGTAVSEVEEAVERYRGYWMSAAAKLALVFEQRVGELNRNGLWSSYRATGPQRPPYVLPLSFDRTEVLYQFEGFRGIRSTSHRWITAHGDVDRYEAVGWYYSDPEAAVDIAPLANCVLDGPLADLPQGGCCGTLRFSRLLSAGEKYYFAYVVTFNSDKVCRPTILYEVRGLSMRSLTVRAQFDPPALPVLCWYFDIGVQAEGFRTPGPGDPSVLDVSINGYVEHEFLNCQPGRQYGLRWIWPDAPSPPDMV